jgi:hypothetical protein
MKKDKVNRTCSTNDAYNKGHTNLQLKILKEKDHIRGVGVDRG